MKKILAILMSAGIVLGTAACGSKKEESPNDFMMINSLGSALAEVYISESTNDDWGANLLGTTLLENEKELEVDFSGTPTATSIFDIAVITQAGTEYQFKSLDLNTANVVTLVIQDGSPIASIQ